MTKKIAKLFLLIIALSVIVYSCEPIAGGSPTLELLTDNKYVSDNDSVAPGDTVLIGLKCTWNGKDVLERVIVSKNGPLLQTIELEAMDGKGVAFGLKYEKSAEEKDSFSFELVDAASQITSLSIVLYKDTSLSDLREIKGIKLGTQENTTDKQLFSISTYSTSYDTAQVDTVNSLQTKIDFVAAYDNQNNYYIGSPASDFNGIYDFGAWEEPNTTEFVLFSNTDYELLNKTKIKDKFEAASDTLEIAKNLTQGSMFLFKTQSNKFGVIKVNSVNGGANGTINFDMKVQR
jgi:hypothetical protein